MTALPAPSSSLLAPGSGMPEPGALPDARWWLSLDDAAAALSVTAGHLRSRKCPAWQARQLAAKLDPGDGRQRWFVSRRADPAFDVQAVSEREQKVAALAGVPDRKVDDALARASCVERYRVERRRQPGAEDRWMPTLLDELRAEHDGLKVSKATLRRWAKAYRKPADLIELVDTRGQHRHDRTDPACWTHFEANYLDQSEPSLSECWRLTREYAVAEGLTWCSESQCRAKLDEKITPEKQARYRRPKEYRDKFLPYVEQDPEAVSVGEEWQGDHCVLDLWCSVLTSKGTLKPVRPWLTAWLDTRSRKVVGYQVRPESPDTTSILASFRSAVLDPANGGPPHRVLIDNGKDYDSYALHGMSKAERKRLSRERDKWRIDPNIKRGGGVFRLLDVEARFALPYNPRTKGRIERWFGTLHDRFDRRWMTYAGRDSVHKPERLAAMLREPRKLPSFNAVRRELQEFIETYNATPSMRAGAEGRSPDEMMAERATLHPRKIENPAALDHCLQLWAQPVKVTRNGVRITVLGEALKYGQHCPELRPLIGTDELVCISYDPEDLSGVWVHRRTPDGGIGGLIARVPLNDRLGYGGRFSKADLAEQLKARKRVKDATKMDRREGLRHFAMSPAELAAQDRADRDEAARQARLDAGPKPPQPPVESPLKRSAEEDAAFDRAMYGPPQESEPASEEDGLTDEQIDRAIYGEPLKRKTRSIREIMLEKTRDWAKSQGLGGERSVLDDLNRMPLAGWDDASDDDDHDSLIFGKGVKDAG
ncbi:MAG: DNA-binding domain-containing protein [Planctomycetota bacterium]